MNLNHWVPSKRFALVALVGLSWLESGLGLVFLSFFLFFILIKEAGWLEFLGLSLVLSFSLSVWFAVSWPMVLLIIWLVAGLYFFINLRRWRNTNLLAALILSLAFLFLAQTHFLPSLLIIFVVELVMITIFVPRHYL